jgi:hypothetical protein
VAKTSENVAQSQMIGRRTAAERTAPVQTGGGIPASKCDLCLTGAPPSGE